MEIVINPYSVYVKVNSNNYIMAINSSAFISDFSGWVKIDEGYGDKYHHAQNNYLSNPVLVSPNVFRYRLIDGIVTECTSEEIVAQEALISKPVEDDPMMKIYDELEAAYQEGVNSI